MGKGLVPWRRIFEILKYIGFEGPISLHSEYDMPLQDIIEQTRRDLNYIKEILKSI